VRLLVLVALALVGCGETAAPDDEKPVPAAPARDEVEGRFVPATPDVNCCW
jgi:hypothetical protein